MKLMFMTDRGILGGVGGIEAEGGSNQGIKYARATMGGTGGLVATGAVIRAGSVSLGGTGNIRAHGYRTKTSASSNLLQDIKEYRSEAPVTAEWGNGTQYTRVFNIPLTDYNTAITGDLALGENMQQAWMTAGQTISHSIDGPKIQSVGRRKQKGGGQDEVAVTFLAVSLPSTRVGGYNETLRTYPRGKEQFEDVTVVWGIAANETVWNIPEEGDALVSGVVTPTTPICRSVAIDETSQHGRVIIRAEYTAGRTETVLDWPD